MWELVADSWWLYLNCPHEKFNTTVDIYETSNSFFSYFPNKIQKTYCLWPSLLCSKQYRWFVFWTIVSNKHTTQSADRVYRSNSRWFSFSEKAVFVAPTVCLCFVLSDCFRANQRLRAKLCLRTVCWKTLILMRSSWEKKVLQRVRCHYSYYLMNWKIVICTL